MAQLDGRDSVARPSSPEHTEQLSDLIAYGCDEVGLTLSRLRYACIRRLLPLSSKADTGAVERKK